MVISRLKKIANILAILRRAAWGGKRKLRDAPVPRETPTRRGGLAGVESPWVQLVLLRAWWIPFSDLVGWRCCCGV